jgi:EAL domain-containing protein (putative c-di-GMP-specific phosphodiesterase class I)
MGDTRGHRLLVVDDDEALLRATARHLRKSGFDVTAATDGEEGVACLSEATFDVILSDISMPGMNGIEFLRKVREHDLDIPVLLMTGDPSLDTALHAIEYGAFGYVAKPFDPDELVTRLRRAATLHAMARLKRQALELVGIGKMGLGDVASWEARFSAALDKLWMAFQPIVDWPERRVVSYEALVRTDEPTLARPDDLLHVAERLGRLQELGRAIRARVAQQIERAPDGVAMFVNLHPSDFDDPQFLGDDCPLHAHASRVVLEVTERAPLQSVDHLAARVHRLRLRGYRIALDDLGAGYAGLSSFTLLEPDIAKLDMSLVRGIDSSSSRRRIVRAMIRLCRQLGIAVVGEGVETAAERDALVRLECDTLQGYLFARPARGFPAVAWS